MHACVFFVMCEVMRGGFLTLRWENCSLKLEIVMRGLCAHEFFVMREVMHGVMRGGFLTLSMGKLQFEA